MNEKIFSASLDSLAKNITSILPLIILVLVLIPVNSRNKIDTIECIFPFVILFLVYLFCFLYRPIDYRTTDNQLIVNRLVKKVILDKSEVLNIEFLTNEGLKGTIRTFGVGGLFGYFGKFRNSNIGNMTWYTTRRNNAILINLKDGRKIVITPDNPESLINELI
jgi:hypothetical protein